MRKKKSRAAAEFHNVCKYCFLIKQCRESQESTRVSKTFREINNMLGFSSLQLKSHSCPKRKQSNIKVIFL